MNSLFLKKVEYISQLLSVKLFEPYNESTDSRIVTQIHNLQIGLKIIMKLMFINWHCIAIKHLLFMSMQL